MIHRLLAERDQLLRRLIDLELGLSLRAFGSPLVCAAGPWSFHRPTHPSRACLVAYVDAVCRLHPMLAWTDEQARDWKVVLRSLHDAFADENLGTLRTIGTWVADEGRPPLGLDAKDRARITHQLVWLRSRIEDRLDRLHPAGA